MKPNLRCSPPPHLRTRLDILRATNPPKSPSPNSERLETAKAMSEKIPPVLNVLASDGVLDAASDSAETLTNEQKFDLGSDWGEDPLHSDIYRWYQGLCTCNHFSNGKDPTKISKLQVWSRNRYSQRLTHRFVLLHMADDTVHRLDRRATTQGNPGLLSGLSMRTPGVTSTDEMVINIDDDLQKNMARNNHLEVEIQLEGKVDLLIVLLTCYQISHHSRARRYDLRDYNCFFYSWTILMIAARRLLDIVTPSKDELMERFRRKEHLHILAESVVGLAVRTLRDLVLAAVGVFREQQQGDTDEGKHIREGMSIIARMVWGLPSGVLETFGKLVLNSKLPSNLRDTLLKQIKEVVTEKAPDVYKQVLDHIDIPRAARDRLWVNEGVKEIVRREVEKSLIEQLWPAVVDAIAVGFGQDVHSAKDIAQNVVATKSWWQQVAGTRTAQLWAVQTAALHGGLKEVKITALAEVDRIKAEAQSNAPDDPSEQLKLLNAGMFDLAWNSARDGALRFAKDAVQATKSTLHPGHLESREIMWETIWGVWDKCWEKACKDARTKALNTLDTVVQAVLNASVKVVLVELGVGESQPTVRVRRPKRVFDIELSPSIWDEEPSMTGLALQQYMQVLMKKAKLGSPDILQHTMAEIWKDIAAADFDFGKIKIVQ
ncbi:hypothetical protein E1B28_000872 [Marasmius oreades]|uniref:Uncharacterized protein n=1 Tax=Marasmius oreades TaxID=181124 RepID=A0A9P7V2B3_9AGAR|nr:uncharacterized protein E1B28_000872 [Marasmius oreades]KAG7098986.1 hypothetical protein E1B28_000872 [Marasmius oreades]